jgi:pyridoxine kinase
VLSVISNLAKELKEDNPDLIYLLDREPCPFYMRSLVTSSTCPAVIGDAGKVYVGADVIPIYRSMLPLATIITPNWFEVE